MGKIGVIGHFDWNGGELIGATVKSRQILDELSRRYKYVDNVDVYKWRERKTKVLVDVILSFARNKNIVLVMSDTSPLLMKFLGFFNRIFKSRVHYVAIGGDIGEILENKLDRLHYLGFINGFYVESPDCKETLEKLGINNVQLMFNFKNLIPTEPNSVTKTWKEPYLFCTFSRVTEQKGITDAINAIEQINKESNSRKCVLHIYGSIDSNYRTKFEKILENSEFCEYKGIVEIHETVDTLKNYFFMLFPTKYQTEGIPGTLIDSFAAALPVICSDWVRRSNLIQNDINGIVYEFGSYNGLIDAIKKAIEKSEDTYEMRMNSLKSYKQYQAEEAILPLIKAIES